MFEIKKISAKTYIGIIFYVVNEIPCEVAKVLNGIYLPCQLKNETNIVKLYLNTNASGTLHQTKSLWQLARNDNTNLQQVFEKADREAFIEQ